MPVTADVLADRRLAVDGNRGQHEELRVVRVPEGLERLVQVELAEPAAEVDQVRRGDLLAAQ